MQIEERLLFLKRLDFFCPDSSIFYNGITNKELKVELSSIMLMIIENFINFSKHSPTSQQYQTLIKISLSEFSTFNLDSQDREQVCIYIEKIMDIIELESSGRALNFDVWN